AGSHRPRRPRVHRAEVPFDGAACRIDLGTDAGHRERCARDARWTAAARDGTRRAAAALEYLRGRHELRRTATAAARRSRRSRRRTARASARRSGLRGTAPRAPGTDRTDAGVRAARHSTREQVPTRSSLSQARELLARHQVDRALVLDYRARCMGNARPEGLAETLRL